MSDPVTKPSHYTDGKIEVMTFIQDKGLNFNRGSAVKYVSRAGKKDPNKEIEDLKKAIYMLEREVEYLESNQAPPQLPLSHACATSSYHATLGSGGFLALSGDVVRPPVLGTGCLCASCLSGCTNDRE